MTEKSDRLRVCSRRSLFRQSDLQRALRAAKAAGFQVTRFDIELSGRISVITTTSTGEIVTTTPFDQWTASRARTS